MAIRSTDNNADLTQVLKCIEDLLAANGWSDCGFIVEAVFMKINDEIYNGFTTIRPNEKRLDSRSLNDQVREYENYFFLREIVTLVTLRSRLKQLNEGTVTFGGKTATVKPGGRWSVESHPSGNEYDNRACLVASTKCEPAFGFPPGPLVHFSNPYFETPESAINSFCRVKLHMSSDSRFNSIVVINPDATVYFDEMKLLDGRLTVSVGGSQATNTILRLKGHVRLASKMDIVDADVVKGKSIIAIDEEIRSISLWLIDEANRRLDHYFEPMSYGSHRSFSLCARGTGRVSESTVGELLGSGECDVVEYKPFIRIGDGKEHELFKTIVAFSNTNGGTLVLGINNEIEVVGIEQGLRKLADVPTMQLSDLMDKYIKNLKQRINQSVYATEDITYHGVEYGGHWLLLIEVAAGSRPPNYVIPGNDIYVRRGANSMRAHPEFDLPRLLGKRGFTQ